MGKRRTTTGRRDGFDQKYPRLLADPETRHVHGERLMALMRKRAEGVNAHDR